MRRLDSEAAASTIAFLIAGLLFTGVLAVVMLGASEVAREGDRSDTDASLLQGQAESMLTLLVHSPGYTQPGGVDWVDETALDVEPGYPVADNNVRLGLQQAGTDHLSFRKFYNLRLAAFDADDEDGRLNYEEARANLGLEEKGLDFHIRTKPSLQRVQDILDSGYRDPNMKITYVGNVDQTGGGGASDPDPDGGLLIDDARCMKASSHDPRAPDNALRFIVAVTNGGETTTQFQGHFEIDGLDSKLARVDQSVLSESLDPDDVVDVHVDIPNVQADLCSSTTSFSVAIHDTNQQLREVAFDASDVTDGAAADPASIDLALEADASHYTVDDDVTLRYEGDYDKDETMSLELVNGTGATVHTDSHAIPSSASKQLFEIPAATLQSPGLGPDDYLALLTHESGAVATQRVLVLASGSSVDPYMPPDASGKYNVDESVAVEVGYLDKLVEQFCLTWFDSQTETPVGTWDPNKTDPPNSIGDWNQRCGFRSDPPPSPADVQPGDVFPDLKTNLTDDLVQRLENADGTPRYDLVTTLVVGSNVDHNVMTTGNFKWPLKNWVEGGGTLIVFGSADQATEWMQPIFHVGHDSSSGGISTPDESHPMLTVADDLNWEFYDNGERTWRYTQEGAEDKFTNVVEQGGEGGQPVTAISDPGDLGLGTVMFTSWLPYDLYNDGTEDPEQGMMMVNNFLTQGYRDLFLDYGPPIPEGQAVVTAVGKADIEHPQLGRVALDVTVYVFPG